jgi:mannose-1-phosphate guanylyltransferase/mannose-1-phosphate guanylyltransferase/mannose-6-phosphate isomerase
VLEVLAFVEKPNRATAEAYLKSGDYLWNSGIFLLPVSVLLDEFSRHEPELLAHARDAVRLAARDRDFTWLDPAAFERCRSVSIDYAIMERSKRLAVARLECGWSDIGSWSQLGELIDSDASGNRVVGETLLKDTRDCYVQSGGPVVATVGLDDLVIVATSDAVLVARNDRDQEIKDIVAQLRDRGLKRLL